MCLNFTHTSIYTLSPVSSVLMTTHCITLKMWNKWSSFLTMRVCCVPQLSYTRSYSHPVSLNTCSQFIVLQSVPLSHVALLQWKLTSAYEHAFILSPSYHPCNYCPKHQGSLAIRDHKSKLSLHLMNSVTNIDNCKCYSL